MNRKEYLEFVRIVEQNEWMVFENDYDVNAIPKQVDLVNRTPMGVEMEIHLHRNVRESFVDKFIKHIQNIDWTNQIKVHYENILPFPDLYSSNLELNDLHFDLKAYRKKVDKTLADLSVLNQSIA